MKRIGISGAGGRMGVALLRALRESDGFVPGGALVRPGDARAGRRVDDAFPDLRFTDCPETVVAESDVIVDFSTPEATDAVLTACMAADRALVIGTTGLSAAQKAAVREAGQHIAVVMAPNTSLGVNLLISLVGQAAAALGEDWDCEIVEAHHRYKADAPSGTALRLGEAVAAARGCSLAEAAVHARHGQTGPRRSGAIGFSTVRGGDIAGEHTVMFAGDGERLELAHRATDRTIFARGALRAAAWVVEQPPGFYTMQDVLGIGGSH
ncbi:MAG: 4-hydroxy-tetrahydrodipicolinate reductase [Gammaproteobacteria bacterium]